MESLLQRIESLARTEPVLRLRELQIDRDYAICEDSDMYGFSHVNVHSHYAPSSSSSGYHDTYAGPDDDDGNGNGGGGDSSSCVGGSLMQSFRNDENWNNPEGIQLMMKAYDLQDGFIGLGVKTNVEKVLHYLEIRKEQERSFSNRSYLEGVAALERTMIAESIHKFTQSISFDKTNALALQARAHAHWLLKDTSNARKDIVAAILIDPNLVPEYDGVKEIYYEEYWRMQDSVLGKRKAASAERTAPGAGSASMIQRLKESILADDEGDSDDSESSKSSESGSRTREKRRKASSSHSDLPSKKHKHKKHKHKHKHKHKRKSSKSGREKHKADHD